MTAVTDAIQVLETLAGKTISGPVLQQIGAAFWGEYGPRGPEDVLPPDPTPEQMAQAVLDGLLKMGKRVLNEHARRESMANAANAAAQAGAAAEQQL